MIHDSRIDNNDKPILTKDGEYVGHGSDESGRVYEGFQQADGSVHYYWTDNGKEMEVYE